MSTFFEISNYSRVPRPLTMKGNKRLIDSD
jgi:hypothetical protein